MLVLSQYKEINGMGDDESREEKYLSQFKYYEGEKHFKFPVDSNFDLSRVNIYTLPSGETFWFDPQRRCVASSDNRMYIQILQRGDFGELVYRIILNIDDIQIQFSKKGGACLDIQPPLNADGIPVVKIEDIGSPLCFYTGHDDRRAGIKRPHIERYQILTNASKFSSKSQQERGIEFVKAAFEAYGSLFGSRATSGNESPGCVEFSADLEARIANGDFING